MTQKTIQSSDNIWFLDIETTIDHKKIHCVVVRKFGTTDAPYYFLDELAFRYFLSKQEPISFIGHNIIGFDAPVIKSVWNIDINVYKDTLVMSRLADPSREGGHSLEAWGKRLGFPKGDNTEEGFFDRYSPELLQYCINDVELTAVVFSKLFNELVDFSHQSKEIEHEVAKITHKQEQDGFQLDTDYAQDLVRDWTTELEILEDELIETFEPTIKVLKTKVKKIPFNPGSRDQIAERLIARGWKPEKFTPTNKPVVDDEVLQNVDIPEAKQIYRYLLLKKRITQVQSWLDAADDEGVVHGKVITNGAVTGRMTHHSPNMAQVPATYSLYGKECRKCWIPREGFVLVGIDAAGLELRMLAHYMDDPAYTETVINGKKDDGSDIHSVNMHAAGLADRDTAKTFIYAFLYGAGAAKIGSIIGGTAEDGRRLIEKFLRATPALARLKEKVAKLAKKGYLPGLDGRKLWVRSEHSALNTLLQGAGAIVMKVALIELVKYLTTHQISYRIVVNVHDEWQIEVRKRDARFVGELGKLAIKTAGEILKLRCPLDGDYAVGMNWAETH